MVIIPLTFEGVETERRRGRVVVGMSLMPRGPDHAYRKLHNILGKLARVVGLEVKIFGDDSDWSRKIQPDVFLTLFLHLHPLPGW